MIAHYIPYTGSPVGLKGMTLNDWSLPQWPILSLAFPLCDFATNATRSDQPTPSFLPIIQLAGAGPGIR
jgi:hypothetical protein